MVDFDYDLPPERIAQTPIEPRDAARLLVSLGDSDRIVHTEVADFSTFVQPGDVIVVNDTKVIPARIQFTKPTGGAVEVLLLDLVDDGRLRFPPDSEPSRVWKALVRPSRKITSQTSLTVSDDLEIEFGETVDGGQRLVRMLNPATRRELDAVDEERVLQKVGQAPLPPYITAPLGDPSRYQTTFANVPGSAAAPTAGLHLTDELIARCIDKGAEFHRVELRVGLDTFRPVSVDLPEDHEIHSERFTVDPGVLDACLSARQRGNRVIAIGTTSVRALESAAASAVGTGRTKLFIYGDYSFQLVDLLLTNFHLPRSSLLLLIDAFVGPRWRDIYEIAKVHEYRFLSFGDAMLLGRRSQKPAERGQDK
jgi:S-adenosylmethionine:tRNA ribosyltransferase-isomerase